MENLKISQAYELVDSVAKAAAKEQFLWRPPYNVHPEWNEQTAEWCWLHECSEHQREQWGLPRISGRHMILKEPVWSDEEEKDGGRKGGNKNQQGQGAKKGNEMDELILKTFFHCITKVIKDDDLPINPSVFIEKYLKKYAPEDSEINFK